MSLLLLYILVTLPALGGRALAARIFGFDDRDAWALGRTLGLVLVAFPAWWAAVAGVRAWQMVGTVLLVACSVWGIAELLRRRPDWRATAGVEAVFLVCAGGVIWLRLVRPEILNQEKLMDLGIFATLLRAESFPPPDMWLAGETLPYYYWGAVIWIVPLALSKIPLDLAYNLIVAGVVALTGCLLWSLGRRAGGDGRSGWLAVGVGLFAGTADGLRQFFSGIPLTGLDYWHSSRQVPDTITEWPLFTLWLGDLHPHLLSMPLALAAVLTAWEAGKRGPRPTTVAATAVLFGVTWAANPWAVPPTLAAAALLMICGDGIWHWPGRDGWTRWLAALVVAVGGWLAAAPFHLSFHPPFQGIARVEAWTGVADLLLWGGIPLIAVAATAWVVLGRFFEKGPRSRALMVLLVAACLVLAAITGRPTLVLLGAMLAVLMIGGVTGGAWPARPAVALAALGVFLMALPEVAYVVDGYGQKLHRMNTVFKCYIQAWLVFAIALPALLTTGFAGRRSRAVALAVILVLALPHPLGLAVQPFTDKETGLDGLAWMPEGDREIVRWLRGQPRGTTIVEAVGGAYTEYARISSASGVPALLGWANHEMVWRGHSVNAETDRRRELVARIYTATEPAQVTAAVREAGVDFVVIGSLERKDFPADRLELVRQAGEIVFAGDGGEVVGFTAVSSSPSE